MADRKVKQTPSLASGLLIAADKIGTELPTGQNSPRQTVLRDLANASPSGLRKLGRYQGRVVLAALAAELALKFLYEQRDGQNVALHTHNLHKLFDNLTKHDQHAIEFIYERRLGDQDRPPPAKWCRKAGGVFAQCRDVFADWRYIGEKGALPMSFEMRVTYLSLATKSVLEVVDLLPLLPTGPMSLLDFVHASDDHTLLS